jgi:hypothetical protein
MKWWGELWGNKVVPKTIALMSQEEREEAFRNECVAPVISDGILDDEEKNLLDALKILYGVSDFEMAKSELDAELNATIEKRLFEPGSRNLSDKHYRRIEEWRRYIGKEGDGSVAKTEDAEKKVIAKTVGETPTRSSIPGEKSISPVDLGPTCPNCGSPGWDVSGACAICAHAERKNLSLVKKDGVIIPVGTLSLRLNQDWAKQKLGEDGIFWDKDWQFSLEQRDQDWVLTPNSASTNGTLVDGVAVTTEIVLSDGILLSVGNQAKGIQKTPLTVRLG